MKITSGASPTIHRALLRNIIIFLACICQLCIPTTSLWAYQYDLAICAIFQSEASYLKEWIEFYKLLGVQHFYLYNNMSNDNYMEVLEPYIAKKEVDLIQWPFENVTSDLAYWNDVQCQAYTHALNLARSHAKWVAFLDTDEFLFPIERDNLVEFLRDYEEFGGLCVNWQCYGTSHVFKIPHNKLLIESLTLKGPTLQMGNPGNQWVKSIVRPDHALYFHDPHVIIYQPGFFQVNANKEHFGGNRAPSILVDKIRINHYWTRDENFFVNVKLARRGVWGATAEGCIRAAEGFNQIKDDTILRFVPALRKAMDKDL